MVAQVAAMGAVVHVAIIQLRPHVRHAAMGVVLHVAIIQLRLHVRHAVMGVVVLVVITLRIPVPIAPLNVHRFVKVSPPKHVQIVLRDAVLVVAMIVIIHVPGCVEENAEHLAAEHVKGNAVMVLAK